MRVIKTEEGIREYLEKNLAVYYKLNSLIPFLGAGFTKGCSAKKRLIPDGDNCAKLMKDMIIDQLSDDESAKKEIGQLQAFDEIANFFYRLVPKPLIQEFISQTFTHVVLSGYRKDFLTLEWRNIYTLNIDDAIERTTGRPTVLPNKILNKKYLDNVVFKLHGDAMEEVTYIKENDGIIFSRKQYLQSLIQNKDLLLVFLEDYSTYNFLIIGCSLENEIDLEYILANSENKSPTKTDKIYVTSTEPSTVKKIKLETFGINICIIVSEYKKFFDQLTEVLSVTEIKSEDVFEQYLIKDVLEKDDTEFNKKIVCGEEEISVINNQLILPSFFANRELTSKLINTLLQDGIIFVVGKRVSGKTFLAYDIIKTLRNERIYYIPSKVSFDSNLIEKIGELNNSIIIFDTDTILASDIEDIYYRLPDFRRNHIRFVFLINSSDRLMVSVPYTRALDSEILELPNIFSNTELSSINHKLSKLGLAIFKRNSNILGNIIKHKIIYHRIQGDLRQMPHDFDGRTLQIYILSAIFDKVYSSLYRALNIDYDIQAYTVEISKKALEFEFELEAIEKGQHAKYKTITNSKSFIFTILGNYVFKNPSNMNAAADSVVTIVAKLIPYSSFRYYWKNLISFDNLNQIFYHPESGGVIRLIFTIYERLETLLYEDNHYWLQRGKSIYYLNRTNASNLQKAIEYSKKPYYDSPDHSRIKKTSSFQIAMIYNRIAVLENFSNRVVVNEAVDWYAISLNENEYNLKIISNFLDDARLKKRKSDFYNLCSYLLENPKSVVKQKRDFLLSKLFNTGFSSL